MATDIRDDLYATARWCLEEWKRLKPRIQRPGRATGTTFESSVRALVVAFCKDDADPGRALEGVVNDERLREMIVGPHGEMKPQSLLEEGLQLLGDASVAGTIASRVRASLAKKRDVVSPVAPPASAVRGGGQPTLSARAGATRSDEIPQGRGRRAENLEQMALTLREVKRERETQSYLDRRQRGASWLAKSYRVVDPDDIESRFIFSWIALNALFGAPRECCEQCLRTDGEQRPRQGRTDLMWFLRRIGKHDSEEKKMFTCLDTHWGVVDETIDDRFLVKDYWDAESEEDSVKFRRGEDKRKANHARNLRDDPVPILDVLLAHRLKTLRNQLIHGAATDRHTKRRANPQEEALFARQADLLEELVGACLEIMENVNETSPWPCIPDPRYESVWHRQRRAECPLMHKGGGARRPRGSADEGRVGAGRTRSPIR